LREGIGRLSAKALEGCSGIEKVYEENGVGIYKVEK
jgi:hypothetical protein